MSTTHRRSTKSGGRGAVGSGIVSGVTAAASHGPTPEVEKTPDAIRAILLPEERDAFDVDCRQALGDAAA